jgi:SAM-dependent methyltransferase
VATELIVYERDGRVERIKVPDEGITIGRKPPPFGAAYCTTNSSVSRLHCRLTRLGESWYIEDLGSANGTNVNGELADGPTPLRPGDTIVIGDREKGLTAKLAVAKPVAKPPPLPVDTIDDDSEQTHLADWGPLDKVRTSYDVVAEKYAHELADDMVKRPLERGMFVAFAELVAALKPGVVGDVGCGPGHVAKHLAGLGLDVFGIDVSAAMIAQARAKFPEGKFHLGSMFELPVADGAWIGAVSLYASLHFNSDQRAQAFRELARVVRGGGFVLHGFYVEAPDQPSGSVYHLEKWFGHKVDLDAYFVSIEDGAVEMDRAGFEVVAALVREPMSTNELPTRRCYMLGKRRAM